MDRGTVVVLEFRTISIITWTLLHKAYRQKDSGRCPAAARETAFACFSFAALLRLGANGLRVPDDALEFREVGQETLAARLREATECLRASLAVAFPHVHELGFFERLEVAAEIPIRPITRVFPLEQANKALLLLQAGKINGAAVLQVAGTKDLQG